MGAHNKIIQPFMIYNKEIYQLLELNKNKKHVGEIYKNNQGYYFIIVDYKNSNHVTIVFLDKYHYMTSVQYGQIKAGAVRNPYGLNVHSGRVGTKYTTSENPLITKIYDAWSNMLLRTDHQYILSHNTKQTSYLNVTVCNQWYLFENFCDWYLEQYNQLNPNVEYHIDKDVLQWKFENKVYGPETCILLPEEINIALEKSEPSPTAGVSNVTGYPGKYEAHISVNNTMIYLGTFNSIEEAHLVYAKAKYDNVKYLADNYYSIGALTDKAYQALLQLDFR